MGTEITFKIKDGPQQVCKKLFEHRISGRERTSFYLSFVQPISRRELPPKEPPSVERATPRLPLPVFSSAPAVLEPHSALSYPLCSPLRVLSVWEYPPQDTATYRSALSYRGLSLIWTWESCSPPRYVSYSPLP